MAASAALALGYKLHVVLPGSRAAFRHDIERNLGSERPAAAQGAVSVNYRFALAPEVIPGAYAWPLSLTVLPM